MLFICTELENEDISSSTTQLSLKTITSATRNFHDENKIGEGGFGPVYKVCDVRIKFSILKV